LRSAAWCKYVVWFDSGIEAITKKGPCSQARSHLGSMPLLSRVVPESATTHRPLSTRCLAPARNRAQPSTCPSPRIAVTTAATLSPRSALTAAIGSAGGIAAACCRRRPRLARPARRSTLLATTSLARHTHLPIWCYSFWMSIPLLSPCDLRIRRWKSR
jgi:hypothetical protein